MKQYLTIFIILFNILFSQKAFDFGASGKDLLVENPIYPIPSEMTFEEYQDMNRRLGVGLLLAAIPIPGTIHSYAGEFKTAKRIRWVAAGSALTIVAGFLSMGKDGAAWEKSPYDVHILNEGEENEKQYAMIPVGQTGSEMEYKFKEIHKESKKGGGSLLIPLGMGMLVGSYLYDYIHGIKVIEEKRDRVRFKYGKKLDFSFNPVYDYKNNFTGVNFSCRF